MGGMGWSRLEWAEGTGIGWKYVGMVWDGVG